MKHNYYCLLVCISCIMACSASTKSIALSSPSLKLTYTRIADNSFFPVIYPPLDSNNIVYLRTVLVNRSAATIAYQTVTCSKEWMYTVEPSTLLEVQMPHNCTVNAPTERFLAPWDTLYQNIAVRIKEKSSRLIRGKIGFGYITLNPSIKWNGYADYRIYRDSLFDVRHNPENIIWRREMTFKRKK